MAAPIRRRFALAALVALGAVQTACPPPWHWRHERREEREERYQDREERREDHGEERRERREDRGERAD